MLAWLVFSLLCSHCYSGLAAAAERPDRTEFDSPQASPFALPIAKRDSLLNGLQLIVIEQPGTGKVTVHLRINSGGLFDRAGKGGLADITARMLLRGGSGLSAKNLNDLLEQLGLTIKVTVGWDTTDLLVGGPKDTLDGIFDLLNRLVITPAFDQKELDILRSQRLPEAKEEVIDEQERCRRIALAGLYGSYPYGRPLPGSTESLQAIGRQDLTDFHARFYLANNAQLLIEGDVSSEQVTRLARARLGTWKKGEPVPPNFRQPDKLTSNRVLLVDHPNATNSQVVLAMMGFARRNQDYFAAVMAIDIFNQLVAQARLGAVAKAQVGVVAGPLTIEMNPASEKTGEAIKSIIDLMVRMQMQAPALEQVEAAKARMISMMGDQLRANSTIADVLLDMETYGLGRDYLLHYAERVNAVTPAEIQAALREYLKPQTMVIAISGPLSQIEADARKLGTVTVIR